MTVVDASVLVSAFNPIDYFHTLSRDWLRRRIRAGDQMHAPVLLQSEVAGALTRRTGDQALGLRASRWIHALPELQLVVVDESLGALAADLAVALRLRGADAVYVALAAQLTLPLTSWDDEQIKRGGQHVTAQRPDGS